MVSIGGRLRDSIGSACDFVVNHGGSAWFCTPLSQQAQRLVTYNACETSQKSFGGGMEAIDLWSPGRDVSYLVGTVLKHVKTIKNLLYPGISTTWMRMKIPYIFQVFWCELHHLPIPVEPPGRSMKKSFGDAEVGRPDGWWSRGSLPPYFDDLSEWNIPRISFREQQLRPYFWCVNFWTILQLFLRPMVSWRVFPTEPWRCDGRCHGGGWPGDGRHATGGHQVQTARPAKLGRKLGRGTPRHHPFRTMGFSRTKTNHYCVPPFMETPVSGNVMHFRIAYCLK